MDWRKKNLYNNFHNDLSEEHDNSNTKTDIAEAIIQCITIKLKLITKETIILHKQNKITIFCWNKTFFTSTLLRAKVKPVVVICPKGGITFGTFPLPRLIPSF